MLGGKGQGEKFGEVSGVLSEGDERANVRKKRPGRYAGLEVDVQPLPLWLTHRQTAFDRLFH